MFSGLSVITEAAVLKKHNLFEDNMALPSESVSSLTDLKPSMGSTQASPARRGSAILPGAPDSEPPSNEVFLEAEEKQQQPGAPGSLAREGSTSIPGSSSSAGGNGQATGPSVDNSSGSPLTAENTEEPPSPHLSEAEVGETLKDEEAACESPESSTTPGSLKELKELLTVTVSVESALLIENDTHKGIPIPQENENEDENKIYPEDATQQDNCKESEVSEREAHPIPLEVEAPGVGVGTLPEGSSPTSQSTCGGPTEDASCLGPVGKPPEAPEATERVLPAIVSTQDTTHAGGEAVEAVAVTPQEDALSSSNPICPVESSEMPQVSEAQEVLGGNDSPALAMDTEQVTAVGVHGCQWVVEDAPSTDVLDVQDYDTGFSEQTSEE